MSEPQEQAGHLLSGFRNWHDADQRAGADRPRERPRRGRRGRRGRAWRFGRWLLLTVFVVGAAGTAASFGYNLATDGPVPRPAGLLMASGGAFPASTTRRCPTPTRMRRRTGSARRLRCTCRAGT
jgi:hypothetical protein